MVSSTARALTAIMMTAMTCSPWLLTLVRNVIAMIADDAIEPM
jgi:hypothetical protein